MSMGRDIPILLVLVSVALRFCALPKPHIVLVVSDVDRARIVVAWGHLQDSFPVGNTLGKVPSEDKAVSPSENAFAVESFVMKPSGVLIALVIIVHMELQSSLSVHLAIFPSVLIEEGL